MSVTVQEAIQRPVDLTARMSIAGFQQVGVARTECTELTSALIQTIPSHHKCCCRLGLSLFACSIEDNSLPVFASQISTALSLDPPVAICCVGHRVHILATDLD